MANGRNNPARTTGSFNKNKTPNTDQKIIDIKIKKNIVLRMNIASGSAVFTHMRTKTSSAELRESRYSFCTKNFTIT